VTIFTITETKCKQVGRLKKMVTRIE